MAKLDQELDQVEVAHVKSSQSREEVLLRTALEDNTTDELQDNDDISEDLTILVTVYNSLRNALGDEAPATIAARENLSTYTSPIVKVKKVKIVKEKAFNEVKELHKALSGISDEGESLVQQSLNDLLSDERISSELHTAITTYLTLASLDLPDTIIDSAYNTLASFGGKRKTSSGDRKPMQFQSPYEIEFNGTMHDTLSAALRAAGFTKDVVDEKGKPVEWDRTWVRVMAQIKKEGFGTAVLDESILSFVKHSIEKVAEES